MVYLVRGKSWVILALVVWCSPSLCAGCDASNLEVGVCLHVYLERDFLSLESIVYPSSADEQRNNRLRYSSHGSDLQRGWVEGPELADYCKKLWNVVKCFEEILVTCERARDFFSFRHLLHSLDVVHQFLCSTADSRKDRFVGFLTTIKCAEEARAEQRSCQRHNVTANVWNRILRLEMGPEICGSLNTQRSCLLENNYLQKHCNSTRRVDIYTRVSALFLSTWCKIPLLPGIDNIPHSAVGLPGSESAAGVAAPPLAGLSIIVSAGALLLTLVDIT